MPVHATAVAIGGRAVVIAGASGAGKSDLALRLIDRGAALIADDQVLLARDGAAVTAGCPATIVGLMEVRGLGVLRVPCHGPAPVALHVTLGPEERMPEAAWIELEGVAVAAVTLDPRPASAVLKVEHALRRAVEETA